MTLARRTLLVGTALAATASAHADTWPSRPIRFIVPFPPGAGVSARGAHPEPLRGI